MCLSDGVLEHTLKIPGDGGVVARIVDSHVASDEESQPRNQYTHPFNSLVEAQLFGQVLRIIPEAIELLCRPAVGNEVEQDQSRRHETLKRALTSPLHSSFDSSRLVVPFMHIVQLGVIGWTVLPRCKVPLVAQLEELQLRTDHSACRDGSVLKLLDRVILVHVQTMEKSDITQGMIGLEECGAIVDCLWLVIGRVLKDELDVLFLVGVVVGMVSVC